MTSLFTFSDNSLENRSGIDPRLIEIDDLAIQITLIDFGHGPYSGLRSVEDQKRLFADGKSKADGVHRLSMHQSGKALDFYAWVDGWGASWEPEHLAMVAAAQLQAASILGYQINWGGLWPSEKGGFYGWDMAHIELLEY